MKRFFLFLSLLLSFSSVAFGEIIGDDSFKETITDYIERGKLPEAILTQGVFTRNLRGEGDYILLHKGSIVYDDPLRPEDIRERLKEQTESSSFTYENPTLSYVGEWKLDNGGIWVCGYFEPQGFDTPTYLTWYAWIKLEDISGFVPDNPGDIYAAISWNEAHDPDKYMKKYELATQNGSSQLNRLVDEGKVPAYVQAKGQFQYDPSYSNIIVFGEGVRLRSQPNTEARIIAQVGKIHSPIDYLGEWTHPNGAVWLVGSYTNWDEHRSSKSPKPEIVWISRQFARPGTFADYESATGAAEEELAEKLARERQERAMMLSLQTIPNEYRRNPLNAKRRWVGELIGIKGRVDEIDEAYHTPMIMISANNFTAYICAFNTHQEDVYNISVNQTVTVKGKVRDISAQEGILGILLDDCEIIH